MTSRSSIALVTGASSGIGAAVALELAEAGHDVALVARRGDLLERVAEQVRARGAQALVLTTDLAQPGATQHVLDSMTGLWGPVRVLVNNAAVPRSGPIASLDPRHWDLSMRLNLTVPFELARGVIPAMRRAGNGWIINIGSVSGLQAHAFAGPYAVAKRGLNALTELLAAENGDAGVRSACLCLGWVATEMAAPPEKVGVDPQELLAPEDVAATVRWLVESPVRLTLGPVLRVSPTHPGTALESVWPRLASEMHASGSLHA
ncbi:SDR family NAD(P)-dependent oxidoreductase [Propionibacterium acidifaciens]|uniref:SDR family NAD(P)-dependent oxidoreductase n=1 Tax=Propionibacterium acidifaciens TaxID=556499 RepID=UPI0009DB6F31|nr:SDR family oxidoreductase [Propionibacterium acidifaciens]